jgi:membrane-associated phospholipid phosphatase
MILRQPRGLLLGAVTVFVTLTGAVALFGPLPGDAQLREVILGWAEPPVIAVLRVANRAGDWRVLLPGTLMLFLVCARARADWWIWLSLMVAAPLVEGLLKEVIGRNRPEATSLGFPSGHATAAAAFFAAVAYLAGSLPWPAVRVMVRIGAVAIIVLVAIARVVLRAHWPSDALGGIALGLTLASAAALAASAQEVRRTERS